MKNHITTLSLLICLQFHLIGQIDLTPSRFTFDPELDYNASIQSPESFLGYPLGESFTLYAHIVDYMKYLSAQSDRMIINQYGETYEGRKLYNVIISSPENIKNIENLRLDNKRLGDPSTISAIEANELINSKPVFISYSYNIHGNEASSSEAVMQVSYRFGAAQDAETRALLDQAILIFYICINPDGRDRFTYWFESVKRSIPASEPKDMEHFEPWPGGRTNHYWFDLNRDWIWGIHPESRGHTSEYLKWMPQIHTDYHEQGYNSNYFTMPGTTPRNSLLPDNYEAYTDTIGRANIAAFNKQKINYFTREAFDFFYPGYGSSYPSVMNAIGMLTEQGGGASRAIETDDGYVLTLRQRIWDHYTTSIATIKKSVERKAMFNRYFYEASNPKNSKLSTSAYFIEDNGDIYIEDVINMLLHHGIEVEKLNQPVDLKRAYSYRTQKTGPAMLPSGTYMVRTDQSKHLFINSVMAPQMEIEDSVMYDMSTWSAPIAYNLDAWSTDELSTWPTEKVEHNLSAPGKVIQKEEPYAYLIEWNQRHAPKALSMLWEKGYRVRSAQEAFSDGSYAYKPGTLIVLLGRNLEKEASWKKDMEDISKQTGVVIRSVKTGRMHSGNDLASRKSIPLKRPKVALLVDRPFSAYTCGQIYFLFDQETLLPVERIPAAALSQSSLPKFGSSRSLTDLNEYDVLILPGGSRLHQVFDADAMDALKSWVSAGGTLVATEGAVSHFTKKEKGAFSSVEINEVPEDTSASARFISYEDRTSYYGKKQIPGAALHARIDISHPLAFGVKPDLFALKFGNKSLEPSSSFQTVGMYEHNTDHLLASGYASAENLELLAGKTFAGVQEIGRGHLVLLLDNTQYRMFWRGPSRMMQNAVMLLPSF